MERNQTIGFIGEDDALLSFEADGSRMVVTIEPVCEPPLTFYLEAESTKALLQWLQQRS